MDRVRGTLRKGMLPFLVILALVFSLGLIYLRHIAPRTHSTLPPIGGPTASTKQGTTLPDTVNAGKPVRIKIPRIGVDSALEHTGLTLDRDLSAPSGPTDAAWYNQGPRPGDSGNAIINGHYGYRNDIPAVFDRLHELRPGDSIYVEDEQGTIVTFVVRASQTYAPDENATDVFHPSDGRAHLNLITCQGAWNRADRSYAARLVVFADKQDS